MGGLREIAAPVVAAGPAGARVRTRLRLSPDDAAVLAAAGSYLGSLAGRDLAARCAERRLDAKARAVSRRERKRALTVGCSSRWAGAITRTSEDAWRLADRNLDGERASLRARVRRIEARLRVPAGGKRGRARGYATAAERLAKMTRLQVLKARLAGVERRIGAGRVSVTRGGRDLLRKRANLDAAGLSEAGWRQQWEAARLFLTADGEAGKPWSNETIRFHPDEGWLEVRLPGPLAHLANRPHGRYRLSCRVQFSLPGGRGRCPGRHRGHQVRHQPGPGSRQVVPRCQLEDLPGPAASLGELRRHRVIAVDVNAGHLAAAVVTPDGNVTGTPFTVPLDLAGLPAATRDGRLRTAITSLIATARRHGARAIVIEDLDFAGARAEGRERHASRPARGRRGGAGDRQTCARPPGAATGRHDRRQPEDQPPESCPPSTRRPVCNQGRRNPPGPAAAPKAEDRAGQPDHPPDQAAQDRSGPPDSRDYLLLSH